MKYYYHPNMPAGDSATCPPSWQGQPTPPPIHEELAQYEREKAAKKELRRCSNGLGAGLLFVQGIGTVLALLIPALVDSFFPGASTHGGVYYDA